MAGRVCRFISDHMSDDSSAEPIAEEIYEKFIQPVVTANFPEFTVHLFSYEDTPGLSEPFLEDILDMDLVIADLTGLNQAAYFELGVRQQSGKPLIFIADEEYTLPLHPLDLEFVRYRRDENGFVEDAQSATDLVDAIERALDQANSAPPRAPAKQSRAQLVARLTEAADAIRLLRINSAMETAIELESIANELSAVPEDDLAPAVRKTLDAFLRILLRLADQLATVRGSRMLISGIISVVLGGAGFSAVAAFGMSLAFWEGKEVFLRAVEQFSQGQKKGDDGN